MEVGREDAADVGVGVAGQQGGCRGQERVSRGESYLEGRIQDSTTSGCGCEGRGMCDDLECLAGRLGLQERKGGGERF